MGGSVGTGTDHRAEASTPEGRTSTFAGVKRVRPRRLYKCEKRNGFSGHRGRTFGLVDSATADRSRRNSPVDELKSALRRVSTKGWKSHGTPLPGPMLSCFPTVTTVVNCIARSTEREVHAQSGDREIRDSGCRVMTLPRPRCCQIAQLPTPDEPSPLTPRLHRRCDYVCVGKNCSLVGQRN